ALFLVLNYWRLSRINIPATMPSTASPVVTVEEILMLSKGKSPVRINQRPSKSIPRFLPVKLLVNVMLLSLWACGREERGGLYHKPGQIDMVCQPKKSPRYLRGCLQSACLRALRMNWTNCAKPIAH